MPTTEHEGLIELFRNRPALAAELLSEGLGVSVPAYKQADLHPAEMTDLNPTEYRADAVVVFSLEEPVLAVVVEVQRRPDQGKRWSWPVYVTTLRARMKCPTILLVVCADDAAAAW